MRFDNTQIEHIRAALLDPGADELIRYMQAHGLSQDTSGFGAGVVQEAHDLGWIASPSGTLTALGICAADSCREYQFWIERDRALPFAGAAPYLTAEKFRGRAALEIGSGMGANLMSFACEGAHVMGVEPVEAYAQIGAIFCEREGLSFPDVRQGSAEKLPFDDEEIDLILCVSAHQYFDIRPALTEMVRVLRPGGEVIIIGGTLGAYIPGFFFREVLARPSAIKAYVITILNTLSYTTFGRRIIPGRHGFTTTRPIYPTRAAMMRLLRQAGLYEQNPPSWVGSESCFHTRLESDQLLS